MLGHTNLKQTMHYCEKHTTTVLEEYLKANESLHNPPSTSITLVCWGTYCHDKCFTRWCVLFYFYIKPQLKPVLLLSKWRCVLFYFYIKPQPERYQFIWRFCCVLFYFYIKPQHDGGFIVASQCCVLFYFYIKPQLSICTKSNAEGCVLFYFYIKPQLDDDNPRPSCVVSYSISTSNHN